MLTDKQIELIARHFIIAAIWADAPEGTSPRASKQAETRAADVVRQFYAAHAADVDEALTRDGYGDTNAQDFGGTRQSEWPFASFGHDLYLTLQGHGTGFWDRKELDEGGLGKRLADAADAYGRKPYNVEPEFYRGWLYLSGGEPTPAPIAYLHGKAKRADGTFDSYWTKSVPVKETLLPRKGQTVYGYGVAIPTHHMVKWNGRWRRVKVAIFGNAGTAYIGRRDEYLTVDLA